MASAWVGRALRLSALGVAAAGLLAARQWMEGDPMKQKVCEVEVTDAEVAIIRSMPVIWDGSESGAPIVCVGEPWQEPYPPSLSKSETERLRRALYAVAPFVRFGELAPGRYEFESALPPNYLAHEPFVANGRSQVVGKRVSVELRPEHLKLLQSDTIRIRDGGDLELLVGIDSKRPYGDMTDFYLDMADLLGITPAGPPRKEQPSRNEFTDTQTAELDALHETMEPALQVFLQRAAFRPGRFRQEPAGYGPWQRIE